MNKTIKTLLASSIMLCAADTLADGRLEGRISDAEGKVFFDGAVVRLKELKLEASSAKGGRFQFNSVPAGQYTLVVDYLGAETVTRKLVIKDNQTSNADIAVGHDVVSMENVLVVGQAASANQALNKQRAADNFKSVISADAIGQFPDANVSEALQRVPGVFIERDQGEGRFVGVRGIDPNLNTSAINGMSIPAPESDRRSVALDVIPSGLLAGLEVTKTVTPDMDGSSIGGHIEVKSLSAFDRDGLSYKISSEGNYNQLESELSPKASGSFTNVFNVGGGELGVAAALSWEDRTFGSDVMEGDGEWDSDVEGSGVRGVKELQQRDYIVNRKRLGAAINLDWRPNELSEYYLRSLYSHFEDQEYRQRTKYKFDKGDLSSIDASSADWADADMARDFKDRFEEQTISSVMLSGMNIVDDWTYEYGLGYSKALENEPGRRDTEFKSDNEIVMGYNNLGSTPTLYADDKGFDPSNFELTEVVIENNYSEDEQVNLNFDITREMEFAGNPGYIKFGAKLSEREKRNDTNADIYDDFGKPSMSGFVDGAVDYNLGNFGPALSKRAIDRFINEAIPGSGMAYQEGGLNGEAYNASVVSSARDFVMNEDVRAAYVMSRVDIEDLRLVYGLRYEQTAFSASGFDARLIEDDVSGEFNHSVDRVQYDQSYSHLLPSVNARYRFNDNTIMRAAFSQTIARPSFGDLTPSPEDISITRDGSDVELSVEAGNPNLKPYEANNFDLAMEFYPGDIGVIGVGAFYKQIDNFIFGADVSDVVDTARYAPGINFTDVEITQPLNGQSADLYGLELNYIKNFDSGFLIQANATFTDSEADLNLNSDDRESVISLPEQADRVGNLMLGYEKKALSLRLSASYKSERLISIDLGDAANDLYQDEHMQIDLTAKYDIDNSLQVYFNAINLNDEPYYRYHGDKSNNAQYEEYGPSFVLGLTYRNF